MKVKVQIRIDNAAYDGLGAGVEVADMLRQLADKIEGFEALDFEPGMEYPMLDSNGNFVGIWGVVA